MNDVLLAADFVLTMDAANRVIGDGAVLVRGNRIAAVGRLADLQRDYPHGALRKLPERPLMPGLINVHCHSGMLRGTAEGLPVWEWPAQYVNPMHRVLEAPEAEAASWLCYAEAALSGTTTLVDMWRFMDACARAAQVVGNRLVAVPYVGAHPDYNYFDTIDDNERMLETWRNKAGGRIKVWVGLEHLFYADEAGQRRAIDLARKYRTGFHTHSSENEIEIPEMQKRYGLRPMQMFERLGFFDIDKAMIAHAVWLDDAEIALLADRAVSVAHNPVSNMKLASGMARVADMLKARIAVGIGTDGEKENNNLDMFEEMKVASLLGKLRGMDAAALDPWDVLRMATITGARCLGHEGEIGSVEAGKKADLIAVRTDTPRLTPLFGGAYFNLHHNLVHAVRGSDVDLVMVDGHVVVDEGHLKTADLSQLVAEVRGLAPGLFGTRAAWLAQTSEGPCGGPTLTGADGCG
jgi:5-methylthioadenosine/S-adenosylhomocysteine deaminase